MKRTLLVINANSGTAGSADEDEVMAALEAGGFEVCERRRIPDVDCPTKDDVVTGKFDAVAVLSGDGTISNLCESFVGWDGEVLVLPGGTMNLLSRRLHGELALADVLAQIAKGGAKASHVPVICFGKREILTGLTVGPSTRWGEVREGIRQGDVSTLAETVPAAWSETISDKGVWIEGEKPAPYSSVFIEPSSAQLLSVMAFRANNIADMLGHGIAWLRRDFREGPKDDFGEMASVTVVGDDADTGLLIDGELEEGRLPLTCAAGQSSLSFVQVA